MSGTPKRLAGPAYLANAVGNIYTPPASTMYVVIRLFHFCNTDTVAHQVSVFIGGTGAQVPGTEWMKTYNIPALGIFDEPTYLPMASTDFLTGLADVSSKVTITVTGDQYVAAP